MLNRRMDETERRAEHLWSIEDNPLAAVALWARARQRKEPTAAAAKRFNRLRLDPAQELYYQALGLLSAGMFDEVRQVLPRLASSTRAGGRGSTTPPTAPRAAGGRAVNWDFAIWMFPGLVLGLTFHEWRTCLVGIAAGRRFRPPPGGA